MYTGLATHLEPHIVRHMAPLDEPPHEIEVGIARGGVCDLDLLQRLVQAVVADGRTDVFSLVNEPSVRGGFTLLHLAASRGYLDIVQWCESFPSPPQTSTISSCAQ